jgi:hypothetical protein
MPTIYVRPIPEHVIPGQRLGRHVRHDSRSLAYPYTAPERELKPVLWTRHTPILNQGDIGSCTGNAMTGALGTEPDYAGLPAAHPALDEAEALTLYSAATKLDPYAGSFTYPPPPGSGQDTGSDGLSVAKAAQKAGLISGYTHCFSLAQMRQALQAGPVIVGVNWYDSFDNPDGNGQVAISRNATVRGGHEFEVRGDDGTNFYADNSWGQDWGPLGGSFTFTLGTMEQLLAEQGDCTVPVPAAQPAPTPTPTPDQPTPADVAFAAVLNGTDRPGHPWIDEHHVAYNHRVQQAAIIWLQAKNLYGD